MGKKYSLKTVALAVKIKSLKKLAKVKQPKVARVELRAGGGLHGPEKLGWSAGGKEKYPGKVKTSCEKKHQQEQTTSQRAPEVPSLGVPSLGVLLSSSKT